MNRINGWELTGMAVNANAARRPPTGARSPRFAELTVQARNLWSQQAALNASKQEINRMLRQALRDGDAVTDFIRTGARAHYGAGSEKRSSPGCSRSAAAMPRASPRPRPRRPRLPRPRLLTL